ncbi:MAG: hypothetical protein ABEH43_01795, partial [Flavobacteriales bacterium]
MSTEEELNEQQYNAIVKVAEKAILYDHFEHEHLRVDDLDRFTDLLAEFLYKKNNHSDIQPDGQCYKMEFMGKDDPSDTENFPSILYNGKDRYENHEDEVQFSYQEFEKEIR